MEISNQKQEFINENDKSIYEDINVDEEYIQDLKEETEQEAIQRLQQFIKEQMPKINNVKTMIENIEKFYDKYYEQEDQKLAQQILEQEKELKILKQRCQEKNLNTNESQQKESDIITISNHQVRLELFDKILSKFFNHLRGTQEIQDDLYSLNPGLKNNLMYIIQGLRKLKTLSHYRILFLKFSYRISKLLFSHERTLHIQFFGLCDQQQQIEDVNLFKDKLNQHFQIFITQNLDMSAILNDIQYISNDQKKIFFNFDQYLLEEIKKMNKGIDISV